MKSMILNELKTAWAGRSCLCFDTLESTNDYAKEMAKTSSVHGLLVTADTQTAGKGRRGRVWESEKGTTISMSLCLEPQLPAEKAAGLTLVAALSAAEAILEVAAVEPRIKWPNDIVVNGRKIGGILTEMSFWRDCYTVVIGLGINVNNTRFPEQLKDTAGSLVLETGHEISRERLIAAVLNHFEGFYEQYLQTEDMTVLKERYEQLLANRGRKVRVLDPVQPFTGIAQGIANDGSLVVVSEDGEIKEISSGEVSVRGLFGYV